MAKTTGIHKYTVAEAGNLQVYEDYKSQFTERIISQVYKHNPHLKDKISYAELSTPLSTR